MWKRLHVGNHDIDYHDANLASKEHSAVSRESLSHLLMNKKIKKH